MPVDPAKTPWELITGGLLALTGFGAWWMERRKKRKEYLDYEPVPQIDFVEYKKQMEAKFQELDHKQLVSSSAILQSIQGVREDLAAMRAVKTESDKRLDRMEEDSRGRWEHIEKRLDRALEAD